MAEGKREIERDRDGVRRRQQSIAGSLWWTGAVLLIGAPVLFFWVVPAPRIDTTSLHGGLHGGETASRLVFAARCNAVAIVPYLLVCIRIMVGRFFEGAHDPMSHAESAALNLRASALMAPRSSAGNSSSAGATFASGRFTIQMVKIAARTSASMMPAMGIQIRSCERLMSNPSGVTRLRLRIRLFFRGSSSNRPQARHRCLFSGLSASKAIAASQ